MAATCQPRSDRVPTLALLVLRPECQITFAPVLALRQKMSALRSPLKSPVPAIRQARLVTAVSDWLWLEEPERHKTLAPLLVLRHRMSAAPSLLKSSTPCACQSRFTAGIACWVV